MKSSFVLSAASASDFPVTGFPEIAFVGRSNVGKSSLINALVKQPIARTSAAPGKTRLANYYLVEPLAATSGLRPCYLVDLPGYGYARGGHDAAREFEELAGQYFDRSASSRRIAGVLHLVDSRHPELPQDAAANAWIQRTGLPVLVVAAKIDKLNQSDKARVLRTLEGQYPTGVAAVSASDGSGLDALWKIIRAWTII